MTKTKHEVIQYRQTFPGNYFPCLAGMGKCQSSLRERGEQETGQLIVLEDLSTLLPTYHHYTRKLTSSAVSRTASQQLTTAKLSVVK